MVVISRSVAADIGCPVGGSEKCDQQHDCQQAEEPVEQQCFSREAEGPMISMLSNKRRADLLPGHGHAQDAKDLARR
jgi:hypothetical protein